MTSAPINNATRTLAFRAYLGGLVVLAVGFLLLAATAWALADSQAEAHTERVVNDTATDCFHDINERIDSLARLGKMISSEAALGPMIRARDSAGLNHYLEPMLRASLADHIVVADSKGSVVVRLRRDEPEISEDNILDQPGVAEALRGIEAGGFGRDIFQHPQGRYLLPVYAEGQSTPVGVLLLAFDLNTESLDYWSSKGNAEYALVYDDQLVLSSLDQIEGKPWDNPSSTPLLTLVTSKGRQLFKFEPLYSPTHTAVGLMGVGVSADTLDNERTGLFRGFVLGFVVLFGGISLMGYLFVQSMTTPAQALIVAVRNLAAGDLSTPITLHKRDALGELASHLDDMRVRFHEAMESSILVSSRFAAAIRAIQVPVVITDWDYRITFVNQKAETLFHQKQAELVGKCWPDVFAMNQESDDSVPYSWHRGSPSLDLESRFVVRGRFPLRSRPDIVLEIESSPFFVRDQTEGLVHVLADVSREKQLTQTKEDFVMNVAHELRGPLASLQVSIDLLTQDYATMSKRDMGVMLRTLQRVIRRFQGLAENLIDVGNVQAGRFRVRPIATTLDVIIQNAIEQTRSLFDAKDQALETDLQVGSVIVLADPPRVTQVLVNLLTNANKYGPEEGPVLLSTWREKGFVYIAVNDQGVGIPPEEQSLVFERFFRAKRAEKEGSGVGVGLGLARAIVEAHGGTINLKTDAVQGTTFWFSVPEVPKSLPGNEPDGQHGRNNDESFAGG